MMVKWLEELAHDCEVMGLIPATDKLFPERLLIYICLVSAHSKKNEEKALATLIFFIIPTCAY